MPSTSQTAGRAVRAAGLSILGERLEPPSTPGTGWDPAPLPKQQHPTASPAHRKHPAQETESENRGLLWAEGTCKADAVQSLQSAGTTEPQQVAQSPLLFPFIFPFSFPFSFSFFPPFYFLPLPFAFLSLLPLCSSYMQSRQRAFIFHAPTNHLPAQLVSKATARELSSTTGLGWGVRARGGGRGLAGGVLPHKPEPPEPHSTGGSGAGHPWLGNAGGCPHCNENNPSAKMLPQTP